MDLSLSEAQRSIQERARLFAQSECTTRARAIEQTRRIPDELLREAGELGLLAVTTPPSYGGAGQDLVSQALVLEELSAACASFGMLAAVQSALVCASLVRFGSGAQRASFLPSLVRGETLGSVALPKLGTGPSQASSGYAAEAVDGGFVLRGERPLVTLAQGAELALVFCATQPEQITAFIVLASDRGWEVGAADDTLGLRAARSATLRMDACFVPSERCLGGVGQGAALVQHLEVAQRTAIAAQSIGIARAAHTEAVQYAKQHLVEGEPLAHKQAIQFMLADIATEIEAARLLTYQAACRSDQGLPCGRESSLAKLYASEMSQRACHRSLQIFGSSGYTTEYNLERYFRDVRAMELFGGTSEIMRIVIAAQVQGAQ